MDFDREAAVKLLATEGYTVHRYAPQHFLLKHLAGIKGVKLARITSANMDEAVKRAIHSKEDQAHVNDHRKSEPTVRYEPSGSKDPYAGGTGG